MFLLLAGTDTCRLKCTIPKSVSVYVFKFLAGADTLKGERYRSNTFLLLVQTSDIFFTLLHLHIVRRKMQKIGAFNKLRKKEIFEEGWSILEF